MSSPLQRAAKADRKFTPDARFQRMFTDKSFNTNYTVDAFGRRQETGKENSELLKFYAMDEKTKEKVGAKTDKKSTATAPAASPAVTPAGPGGKLSQKQKAEAKAAAKKAAAVDKTGNKKSAAKKPQPEEDDEEDETGGDEDVEDAASDAGSEGFDGNYMSERGMAPPSSEEDADQEEGEDDDNIEEDDDDEDAVARGENSTSSDSDLDAENIEMEDAYEEEVIPTGDAETSRARRLAVMNLEWDRLGAVDLLVLFRSFIPQPANGTTAHPVRSVKVYPSEFGRQRMASEAMYGPTAIYAGGITEEQYKQRIQQKMNKVQTPLQEEEVEDEKEQEEEDSERSSSDEEDSGVPSKRKRVSFPAGTKNSTKKTKFASAAAATTTPAKKKKRAEDDDDEALREAEDDILSRPAASSNTAGDDSDDSSESSEGANGATEFDKEKLRQYELERLKYFYAIVDCDTATTAEALYRACDGLEFEHSSNLIDLRYVPDDVTFSKEEEATLRDQASKVPSNYKAPEFYTQALQHTNVQLTWDRDDPVRAKLLQKKFQPEDEATADLKAYLGSDDEEDGYGSDAVTEASDSGSDDDDNEKQASAGEDEDGEGETSTKKPAKKKVTLKRKARAKYLALLQELKKPADDDGDQDGGVDDNHEVSITFEPGLKALGETISTKMLNKDKEKAKEGESTWEKHLRERLEKKKEKKKLRKEKLKGETSAAAGDNDEDSGDEIGGANARMESDLYEDDDVVMDEEDDFFRISDDEDLEPPKGQRKQNGKGAKDTQEDDDESEMSMSSESGEEHMDDDSGASEDEDHDDDAADIDDLRGQARTKRMFDESRPVKKTPPASKQQEEKDGKKKLKRKRADDDDAGDDNEDSAKSRAELELLLMDETPEETARGYSLKALLKQKKMSQLAADGGSSKQSKKARKALESAAAAGGADSFQVDTADSRFEGLFVDSAFAIDPTHPSFKSTAGTEQLLHEKAKRRHQQEEAKAKEIARRKEQAKKGGTAGAATAVQGAAAHSTPSAASTARVFEWSIVSLAGRLREAESVECRRCWLERDTIREEGEERFRTGEQASETRCKHVNPLTVRSYLKSARFFDFKHFGTVAQGPHGTALVH